MLAVSWRALPLSHSCRNRSESLRETHGELIRKTRHLFEGNDTSGPRQICGFRKQNVSKAGFFFLFCCVFPRGKKQTAAAANVQRRRSNRGYEVRETVSQLGPAGTVSGCAPVVSAHEVKTERETGTNIPES